MAFTCTVGAGAGCCVTVNSSGPTWMLPVRATLVLAMMWYPILPGPVPEVALVARARSDRRGEEAPLVAVGFGEDGELPAGVVLSGIRLAGQHDHDAKLVDPRAAGLVGKDVHDLPRPQELGLP